MVKRVGSLSAALSKYKDVKTSVRVGVLENATYPDGTSVAMVAFWNEYGTRTMPVRSFFRSTVAEQKKNWVLSVKNLMKIHNDPEKVMGLIGTRMSDDIKAKIVSLKTPSNSDVTLLLKSRFPMGVYKRSDYLKAISDVKKGIKGAGSNTNPLVWSGQMLRSINFEVGSNE